MKRPAYAFFSLAFVFVVSLLGNPNSEFLQKDLGYIGRVNEGYSSYTSNKDTEEATAEPNIVDVKGVEIEDNSFPTLSGLGAKSIESVDYGISKENARREFINWRKSLKDSEKTIFKKIMRRRRKRFPDLPRPTKKEGMRLLKRALRKIEKELFINSINWNK